MRSVGLACVIAWLAVGCGTAAGGVDAALDAGIDASNDAAEAGPPDVGLPAEDMGPVAACDLTGHWSGMRTDVSGATPVSSPFSMDLVQTSGHLVVTPSAGPSGTGTIVGTSVNMMTGAVDYSGNWYVGSVDVACTTLSGEWNEFEMVHGPFVLTRP
jgi:hypothetical protein